MGRTDTAVRVISAPPDRVYAALTDPDALAGPLREPQTGHRAGGGRRDALLLVVEAVAQTPGEATGSLLRVRSEIGHLVRRELPARRKVVPHGGSGMHLRERAAHFLRRLYATASRELGTLAETRSAPPVDDLRA